MQAPLASGSGNLPEPTASIQRGGTPSEERIRAERMDAASRMASALAHEIASYLGAMRTTLYLLTDELGDNPEARQDCDALVRTVEEATQLVEALRRFARAEPMGSGQADLEAVLREAATGRKSAP